MNLEHKFEMVSILWQIKEKLDFWKHFKFSFSQNFFMGNIRAADRILLLHKYPWLHCLYQNKFLTFNHIVKNLCKQLRELFKIIKFENAGTVFFFSIVFIF